MVKIRFANTEVQDVEFTLDGTSVILDIPDSSQLITELPSKVAFDTSFLLEITVTNSHTFSIKGHYFIDSIIRENDGIRAVLTVDLPDTH